MQTTTEKEQYKANYDAKVLIEKASQNLTSHLEEAKGCLEETSERSLQTLENHQPIEIFKLKANTARAKIDSSLRMFSENCAEILQSENVSEEKIESMVEKIADQLMENLDSIKETFKESMFGAFNSAKDSISKLAAKAEDVIKTTQECAGRNMESISSHQHGEIAKRTADLIERVKDRQETALALVLESSKD